VRAIVGLPDPVGEVIEGFRLPNGIDVRRVRTPLGVVAIVYEARPNVTTTPSRSLSVGQRDRACAARRSPRTPIGGFAAIATRRPPRPGCPRGRSGWWPGVGADELADLATQDGLVT